MGLRDIAERDLAVLMEDSVGGFGWPITVTDPDGESAALVGLSNDIALVIDPDTGVVVSGRQATVALRMSSLAAAELGVPTGVADGAGKPWIVVFNDIGGVSHTFKVRESNPDRTIGLVVCILEVYKS